MPKSEIPRSRLPWVLKMTDGARGSVSPEDPGGPGWVQGTKAVPAQGGAGQGELIQLNSPEV